MTEQQRTSHPCPVSPYSDPPQDCGAPFCGCNPAWTDCIEMLLECGWSDADTNRLMMLAVEAAIERMAQAGLDATSEYNGLWSALAKARGGDEIQMRCAARARRAVLAAQGPDHRHTEE